MIPFGKVRQKLNMTGDYIKMNTCKVADLTAM